MNGEENISVKTLGHESVKKGPINATTNGGQVRKLLMARKIEGLKLNGRQETGDRRQETGDN